MPAVAIITIRTLNEDGAIAETLGEHFAADVRQSNALADVTSRQFDRRVALYAREETETETIGARRIGEAVDCERRKNGVERFADAILHLVVGDRAPVLRFLIRNRFAVCRVWVEGGKRILASRLFSFYFS